MQTNATTARSGQLLWQSLHSQWPSLIINIVFPFLIYTILNDHLHFSSFWSLVLTGVPSILYSLYGILGKRKVDFIAGFTLFTLAISVGIIALGGDQRIYLLRESLFTGVFGLACLISMALPQPLIFYFARQVVAGNDPARMAWWEREWRTPHSWLRPIITLNSLIYGIGFLIEFGLRAIVILTQSIETSLLILPILGYSCYGAMILLASLWGRALIKRLKAQKPPLITIAKDEKVNA